MRIDLGEYIISLTIEDINVDFYTGSLLSDQEDDTKDFKKMQVISGTNIYKMWRRIEENEFVINQWNKL